MYFISVFSDCFPHDLFPGFFNLKSLNVAFDAALLQKLFHGICHRIFAHDSKIEIKRTSALGLLTSEIVLKVNQLITYRQFFQMAFHSFLMRISNKNLSAILNAGPIKQIVHAAFI